MMFGLFLAPKKINLITTKKPLIAKATRDP